MFQKIFLLSCLTLSAVAQQTTLILDLGGVVLTRSMIQYMLKMRPLDILFQSIHDQTKPWLMQESIFELLKTIDLPKEEGFRNTTTKGVELPYIICAYQAGRISADDALTRAREAIASHPALFKSTHHQRIVERAIEIIFSPECEADCSMEIPAGMRILKELSDARSKGIIKNIFGLTNWEKDAFARTRAVLPGLSYFDDIITSGEIGTIKPNEGAYRYVLEKHHLEPSECLFVDDQLENVLAARECGIESLLFTDCYQLRKDLYDRGILPTEPINPSIQRKKILALSLVVGVLLIVIECIRRRAV